MNKIFGTLVPSEIVLLKVLVLGIYFGWIGRKVFTPKVKEISNIKFGNFKDNSVRLKL